MQVSKASSRFNMQNHTINYSYTCEAAKNPPNLCKNAFMQCNNYWYTFFMVDPGSKATNIMLEVTTFLVFPSLSASQSVSQSQRHIRARRERRLESKPQPHRSRSPCSKMPNNSLVKVTLGPGECEAARVILNNYLQSGGSRNWWKGLKLPRFFRLEQ